ncbi:MAG: methyltransferase domain-containing protein [Alphaproteobacteria bacterium]|nr:methyltransferase domain-containing protein [Alphaproteobacteria bacterium]
MAEMMAGDAHTGTADAHSFQFLLRAATSPTTAPFLNEAVQERFLGPIRAWIGGKDASARARVLAALVLIERQSPTEIARSFDGGPYRPAALTADERRLLAALADHTLDHPEQPAWVRGEFPKWLTEQADAPSAAELGALNQAAPLDLRVNALAGSRDQALAGLAAAGIEAAPTALSPLGLRVVGRPPLGQQPVFQEGLVEVQDEGSQLVALLADARPGQAVIDFCAGAGGKTLALAGAMQNKGRLIACDVSAPRLERAVKRLRRAGVHNVERRALGPDANTWLKRQAGRFDRVLVDAPCSGTGTWRRNPDMKWRLGPDDVAELQAVQADVLDRAAKLVKPGGRLIYATCSLLAAENEGAVDAFLARRPEFRVLPVGEVWASVLAGQCPTDGPYLRLTPARHNTDGFFAAILERTQTAQKAPAAEAAREDAA